MIRFLIAASFGLASLVPALAGGMGDPSTNTREKNAICEQQRRGVGPLTPNLCMPELPVDYEQTRRPAKAR